MNVTLQYFNGCPNWKIVDDRLRELVDASTVIEYRLVESQEDAEHLGFRGSPTILVDGVDPFAKSDEPVGLACRIYHTAEGRGGAPSMDQLRKALGIAP
jgi:hypothetical protein